MPSEGRPESKKTYTLEGKKAGMMGVTLSTVSARVEKILEGKWGPITDDTRKVLEFMLKDVNSVLKETSDEEEKANDIARNDPT